MIKSFHVEGNLNFQQISDLLIDYGYKTPRGKTFTEGHCWSIYTKKQRSIQRFEREFDPVIKDMRVDVVNYIPVPSI